MMAESLLYNDPNKARDKALEVIPRPLRKDWLIDQTTLLILSLANQKIIVLNSVAK